MEGPDGPVASGAAAPPLIPARAVRPAQGVAVLHLGVTLRLLPEPLVVMGAVRELLPAPLLRRPAIQALRAQVEASQAASDAPQERAPTRATQLPRISDQAR